MLSPGNLSCPTVPHLDLKQRRHPPASVSLEAPRIDGKVKNNPSIQMRLRDSNNESAVTNFFRSLGGL